VAIESGDGLVLSHHVLEVPWPGDWSERDRTKDLDVHVVTKLEPGRVETLVWNPVVDVCYLQ
jgi:hypothetical protein